MPIGAAGADETIQIPVVTTVEGVKKAIDDLKQLGAQLTAIDKQLRSGLNSDALSKQFADIAKQFDKATKSVVSGSADSEKAVSKIRSEVEKLNAEMLKAQKSKGIGFIGDKTDSDAIKRFKKSMENVGTPVMGGAKSVGMLVRNMRSLSANLNDTSKAGIATRASIDAVHSGGAVAFMPALTRAEQFNIKLASLRKNITGLTQELQSAAKDKQWVGRQMIEGITVPIAGIGTMAVRSFMAAQSEMIQLKKVTEFGAQKEDADAFYDSLVNGTQGIREMSREFGIGRKAATGLFKDVAALGVDGEQDIKDFANAVSEVAMVGETDTATAMQFFRTMNAIFADGKTNAQGLADTRDLMAQMSAVADETSLQLSDLAAAFPEVAPVMDQMGFSAGGVAASLAGMYKRGIPATEAAHGLKFALQRLVSPTKDSKELIDKMGFSFFDAGGNVKKADVQIMALAKNLEEMSPKAASEALGELFGLRQTARMQSYFQDINIGRKELEKLGKDGFDATQMTSDFARGLVASGEFAGAAIKPMDRYNKALEEIKKDPTTGLKRLKSAFDDFKVQLGATIAPAVLQVGEQLTKLLDAFSNLPAGMQIALIGAAGFLAVLGPIAYMGAQATHAIASMGRMAASVLPKMVDITEAMARSMAAAGRRDVAQVGSRFVGMQKFADRFRLKLGIPTTAEKAVKAAGGVSSLGPETAATGTLTSAKNSLEAASARVAAAEAVETAAHQGNTAAMAAETVATQKAAQKNLDASKKNADAFKSPIQRAQEAKKQLDEERKKILASGGFEPTGFKGKNSSQYRKNGKFAANDEVAAYLAEHLARKKAAQKVIDNAQRNQDNLRKYNAIMAEKSIQTAVVQKQKKAFTDLVAKAQTLAASATAAPATKAPLIAGDTAGKTTEIFKSLWTSANTTFFTPIGNAASAAKNKIVDMARAAKMSSIGQGVAEGFGATAGAFTKGRKGKLGADAAGMAASANLGPVGKMFGGLGKIFGKFTGALSIGAGPIGKILTLFLRFNKVTLILAAVGGIIAFVVTMFKGMKTNWEAVMAKIQPGIDAIKAAFGRLKETFAGVFEKMTGIFGQLGTGAEEGEGAASAFEGIGGIIGKVFEGIAAAIGFVGTVIEFIMPYFETVAYIVKNTVGFISSLFQGEWKQAFMFALATVYEWVRPVLMAFDIVVRGIAQAISTILDLMSKIPLVGNSIKGAAKAVEAFSDTGIIPLLDDKLRSGLGGVFGPGTTGPAKKEAEKTGGDIGNTLGDAINSGAGGAADGESWVKKWTDKVVSVLEKELDKIRKSAVDALEKTHEAALKVYDDRIKAIEDQEKAEEKLYKTEEYLANKRNLLSKRNIDRQNYENERAVAIYEGRYNDARMLDLKERADKQSYSDDLAGIEESRAKDLLKETRDNLKDLINLEKDAAKERFDIQKKILEAYLDEILKMTPLTVGEMQSAMDRINQVLSNVGAGWPEYARGAMDVFSEVFKNSNDEIVNEFRKSGEDAVLNWVAGFVSADALAAIKAQLSKNGGGGGAAGNTGATSASADGAMTPELANFLAGLSPSNINNTVKDAAQRALDETAAAAAAAYGGLEYTPIEVNLGDYGNNVKTFLENTTSEYFQLADGEIINKNEAMSRQISGGALNIVATTTETMYTMYSKNGDAYKKMLFDMEAHRKGFDQSVLASSAYTTQQVIRYQDENGENWIEVNGVMRSESGKTATAIKDSSGRITSVMTEDAKRVEIANTTTFVGARSLMQEMIDKGLKPGQVETQLYIDKINGMGFAIDWVNGKPIVVKIDMNTESFWRNAALVSAYTKSFEGRTAIASQYGQQGSEVFEFAGAMYIKYADGTVVALASGGMVDASSQSVKKFADGGLVKNQKNGILANIGEGGFDEFVITTDPKYRASNLGYLSAAASKLGVKMASGAAIKAASGGMFTSTGASGSSAEYASGMGGDVYINVDTFIGEEEWFASMASKYNMKTVPRQRKIEGQQKRVVSSYNDRYRLR
jgi:TP901 family phage tail tape measure protein